MTMKIAVCFSGQPRSLEAAYPYYKKNLFDPNPDAQIDVFCHSWEGVSLDNIYSLYKPKKGLLSPSLPSSLDKK